MAIKIVEEYRKIIPAQTCLQIAQLLEIAKALDAADMCLLQVYDEVHETLHIVAGVNYPFEFYEHFRETRAFDSSASGRAIGHGSPVIIGNVLEDSAFEPHLEIAEKTGFKALKSIPIKKKKHKLGVVSTHFKETKEEWNLTTLDDIYNDFVEVLEEVSARLEFNELIGARKKGTLENR